MSQRRSPVSTMPGMRHVIPATASHPTILLLSAWVMFFASGTVLAQYHVYWGDLHGHTQFSDGKGTLDGFFTHARDVARFDFVIVTDHDFGNGPPWRMPTNHWTLTQAKADEFTVKGRFVAIAGYEWTSRTTLNGEQTIRAFLKQGGRTGFVGGSDTHEGTPAARTAVLARELTREAIFDALRHRRTHAITHARIGLNFRINGHVMGEAIECEGDPEIVVEVNGTDRIREVVIIRDGAVLRAARPEGRTARLNFADPSFVGPSYYYVRVIQADQDKHGNRSQAWSSPVWVKKKQRAIER